jgi:hypothetical protein
MNYLIDKFFIYLESIFKGKLPIKYEGIYIIENIWVIHYECLSVNPLNVDEAIKECIHIRYSVIHDNFLRLGANDEYLKYLSDLFEKTLKAFVCLDQTLKNKVFSLIILNFKIILNINQTVEIY